MTIFQQEKTDQAVRAEGVYILTKEDETMLKLVFNTLQATDTAVKYEQLYVRPASVRLLRSSHKLWVGTVRK